MGLFSKPEYLEVVLPFVFDSSAEDAEACIISIEAFGYILDSQKYCFASFEASAHDYDALSALLAAKDDKRVKIIAKVKSDVVKDFKIDLNDLAKRFGDLRFEKLSLCAWSLNDTSVIEGVEAIIKAEELLQE